jgi:hypothetical protein
VYLTRRWLPSKQLSLRLSIDLHVLPRIRRVPLRHLCPYHFERLYAELPDDGRSDGGGGLQNKTVVDAVRRGLLLLITLSDHRVAFPDSTVEAAHLVSARTRDAWALDALDARNL